MKKNRVGKLSFIKRYLGMIAAMAIFLLIVIGVGVYTYFNGVRLAENSVVLNAIGQQKTLSQKISKDMLLIQQEFASDEKFNKRLFEELLRNKASFQNLLEVLQNGGTVVNTDDTTALRVESIKELYNSDLLAISKSWSPLNAQIDALATLYTSQIKSKAEDSVDSLLVSRKNRTFIISAQNETLPNDLLGSGVDKETTRMVNLEQNILKDQINAELQETTRILKNNNLPLLFSIDGLNSKLNKLMAEDKNNAEKIQVIGFGVTILVFLILLVFFFAKLIKSDLLSYRDQKEKSAILENVREGLFLMNENWIIEKEGSAVLSEILGKKIVPPMSFFEIMEPLIDEKTSRNAKEFVKILFTKDVKESMIASLNPLKLVEVVKSSDNQTAVQKKQFLSINFNKIKDESGKVIRILVTILDSTEQKKLEEKLKEEKLKSSSQFDFLLKIIQSKDKGAVIEFFKNLQETIFAQNESLKTSEAGEGFLITMLNKIQREIHTLKSEAAVIDLVVFQNMLHDFEEKLNEIKKKKPIRAEDLHIISFYHKDILEKTGGIIEAIEGSNQGLSIVDTTTNIKETVAKRIESDLKVLVKNNSKKLNKNSLLVTDITNLEMLEEKQKDSVRSVLLHMVNNSVAHGIEIEAIRVAANKHPLGTIKIYDEIITEGSVKKLAFHVVDDGAGINFNRIRERALELGLNAQQASPAELLGYIFMPNFSTNKDVDTVSGRGIGMDFVKTEVEKMGGKIGVKLRPGSYTEFTFTVPINE